jgi:hypothetical protein
MSRADQINRYLARGGIVRLRTGDPEWHTIVHAAVHPTISTWTLVMYDDDSSHILLGDDQDCYTLEYAPGPDFRRGEQP